MAIIDLPQTRGFYAAQFTLGLDVSESTFTGALTGNRQRRSNLADRLRGTLLLPPTTSREAAGQREALLMGLRSGGDWLRMGMPHRPAPLGTVRGAPTVAATVQAGARSFTVQDAATKNLVLGGSFETDTNADGLADGWLPVASVDAARTHTVSLQSSYAVAHGTLAQEVQINTATTADDSQLRTPRRPLAPSTLHQFSASIFCNTAAKAFAAVYQYTSAGVQIGGPALVTATVGAGAAAVVGGSFTSAANAALFDVYIRGVNGAGQFFRVDAVQLVAGAAVGAYPQPATLLAGDFISVGGNLLQVAYGGAQFTDAGTGTVPLVLPLQRQVVAGAVLNVLAPTGVWELDDEGLQLDYGARNVQAGLAVPLRQVVV